ncbi:hypothetical protein CAEBREN_20340 [Caenorhabditis brenneri]|uniref:Uncharacterized protein n=1 Tax=Caenorhabditis brenneri TaxID=135651 RepID=G0PNT6_CAEBE|nr:hypothetical protein CAEBREN_20340 [Caenorhabditis brenneri]
MKTLLLLFSLVTISYSFGVAQYLDVPVGKENVELKLATGNVKVITRKLAGSEEVQTWNVEKKTWQDSKGKPITSTNFSYKAPGTLILKKVAKADAGFYDYEMLKEVTEAQKNLPEGVFVDVEPMLTGIELIVQ